MSQVDILRTNVMQSEGYRPYAYTDSQGYWTIGYGRLIDRQVGGGISNDEALYLLENDLKKAVAAATVLFPTFQKLSEARQAALSEMAFNLGQTRLAKFVKLRQAVQDGNWPEAKKQALYSTWAAQVGKRADRIADMLEKG